MGTSLASAVLEPANLVRAWDHVRRNDAADGETSRSIARFAEHATTTLASLAACLEEGTWVPGRLHRVQIPKSGGGARSLLIGSAQDRVVERALTQVLAPIVDPHLGPCSFGYRAGLGVADAIERLVELREEGHGWVLRTDFADCFEHVDRRRVLDLLSSIVEDDRVMNLVHLLLGREVDGGSRRIARLGIPQGGSMSPMLANLYLEQFDHAMAMEGFPMVRFADDVTLVAVDQAAAHEAEATARRQADALGLMLAADKTKVTSFAEGFAFLGEDLNARYPPAAPTVRRADPERRVLYVGYQGAGVRFGGGRIEVFHGATEVLSVPAGHVARVVLVGSVGLTAGARSWALGAGVDVVFLSRRGRFQGVLQGPGSPSSSLRRAQYRSTDDDDLRRRIGQRLILGKITNQRALLIRFGRREQRDAVGPIIEELAILRVKLPNATTVSELMGIEGFASRRYFDGLQALLPPDVGFHGRERRPPPDLVNAALGYGYAVLEGEALTACAIAGLDPAAGFLHSDHGRRRSLALDLMEEMRPLVVDAVVVGLCRRGSLTFGHTRTEPDRPGVLLTDEGRKRLTAALEDRLLTVATHPGRDQRMTYRRALHVQAGSLASSVRSGHVGYQPVTWR